MSASYMDDIKAAIKRIPYDEWVNDEGCPECDDGNSLDAWESSCIDDLCNGGEVPCMHGQLGAISVRLMRQIGE